MEYSRGMKKDCGDPIQGSLEFLSFIGVMVQIVVAIVNNVNNNNNNDNNNNNNNNENNDNDNIFKITITNTRRVITVDLDYDCFTALELFASILEHDHSHININRLTNLLIANFSRDANFLRHQNSSIE